MEEKRAAAGGVVVHASAPQAMFSDTKQAGNRILNEIKQAKELLDTGVISDAEFQDMKSKILGAT